VILIKKDTKVTIEIELPRQFIGILDALRKEENVLSMKFSYSEIIQKALWEMLTHHPYNISEALLPNRDE